MTVGMCVRFFIGSLDCHLAAISAGDRRLGRPVDKMRIIEEKKLFSKFLVKPLPRPRPEFARGSLREFSIFCPTFSEACEAWGVHHFKSGSVFLVFSISCF